MACVLFRGKVIAKIGIKRGWLLSVNSKEISQNFIDTFKKFNP